MQTCDSCVRVNVFGPYNSRMTLGAEEGGDRLAVGIG